jgi:hypothetical protein
MSKLEKSKEELHNEFQKFITEADELTDKINEFLAKNKERVKGINCMAWNNIPTIHLILAGTP